MEQLISLFTIFLVLEAINLLYNIIASLYNIHKDHAIAEAQKSVNILSQRYDDMRNSYEKTISEKLSYINTLLYQIKELEDGNK